MRNMLVTGGSRNVGESLAKKLVTGPENFVVVDDLFTGGGYVKIAQ
jgi:hypothetical protein